MRAPALVEEDTKTEGATEGDEEAAGVDDGVTGVADAEGGRGDDATDGDDAGDA
jgi:hypothetical protein